MIHPTREDWMSYLYDELEAQPRRSLDQHLAECPECQARLNEWRNAGRQLDAYTVSARPAPRFVRQPWLRWTTAAAAAAIVLTAGVALGRSGRVPTQELADLRSQIAVLTTNYASLQANTLQFAGATDRRFQLVQAQQANDIASLHKELETVAVLTEASFQRTENKLVQLASADTANNPNAPLP